MWYEWTGEGVRRVWDVVGVRERGIRRAWNMVGVGGRRAFDEYGMW